MRIPNKFLYGLKDSDDESEPCATTRREDSKEEQELEQESEKELEQESEKELEQESEKELEQESEKELKQESEKELEQQEVAQESEKELEQESEKELEQQEVEKELEQQEVAQESEQELEKEVEKEVEKESKVPERKSHPRRTKKLLKQVTQLFTKALNSKCSDIKNELTAKVRLCISGDPNHPKRPLSSYMYFCADIRNENQEQKFTAKQLSEIWKATQDKNPWIEKAKIDKQRYLTEMEKYKPKRPMTAYNYFCKEMWAVIKYENPNYKIGEMSRALSSLWQEEDKNKWKDALKAFMEKKLKNF